MLNLLPAILLLLLQGPVSVQDGLPAGSLQNREVRLLLDSLGRLAEVPELAEAVAKLLREQRREPVLQAAEVKGSEPQALLPDPRSDLRRGFSTSQRSRDGPFGYTLLI